MRMALAVAVMTFREAVRDRILYLLLAFALVMIAAARFLALLTVGSETRIVTDTGMAAIASSASSPPSSSVSRSSPRRSSGARPTPFWRDP